jgi:hypothetical protein
MGPAGTREDDRPRKQQRPLAGARLEAYTSLIIGISEDTL